MSTDSQDVTVGESEVPAMAERLASSTDAGRRERIATATLGGALVRAGLRRRSLGGAAAALAGGWLVYQGVRGRSLTGMVGSRLAGREPEPEAETEFEPESESEPESMAARPTAVQRSITVGKPADELTQFWLEPQHLSRIFGDVAEVTAVGGSESEGEERDENGDASESDDGDVGGEENGDEDRDGTRYRWTAEAPLGRELTWETEVVEERPGELVRWESVEGATIPHTGTVRFQSAPGDRGTEVTLSVHVDPPGGPVGEAVLNRTNLVSKTLVGAALRRFKSLAETGEIPTLERNPSARGKGDVL